MGETVVVHADAFTDGHEEHAELFRNGEYLALEGRGLHAEHVCAFARLHRTESVIAVAPRWYATLLGGKPSLPLGRKVWADTSVQAPTANCGKHYENVLTGERIRVQQSDDGAILPMSRLLAHFPVALLRSLDNSA